MAPVPKLHAPVDESETRLPLPAFRKRPQFSDTSSSWPQQSLPLTLFILTFHHLLRCSSRHNHFPPAPRFSSTPSRHIMRERAIERVNEPYATHQMLIAIPHSFCAHLTGKYFLSTSLVQFRPSAPCKYQSLHSTRAHRSPNAGVTLERSHHLSRHVRHRWQAGQAPS